MCRTGKVLRSWKSARTPNPPKFKVAQKWLKSGFRGLPQSGSKVTKSDFLTRKSDSNVIFSGQSVTFGVTFKSLWGNAQKVTPDQCLCWFFEHFTVVNLKEWWLHWLLNFLKPITWSWSPQTWQWGLILMVLKGLLALSWMPLNPSHRDVAKWSLTPHRMTVWPWTLWCLAWTPCLILMLTERRCWEGVGESDAWANELIRSNARSCDWQWVRLTLTREIKRDSAWALRFRHLIPKEEFGSWRLWSHPWMRKDALKFADASWATWCLTTLQVPNDEGDHPAWRLRWSCRWWWDSLMMVASHDEHREPQRGRSWDRLDPPSTDGALNWCRDLTPWLEEREAHDAVERAWTLHHWGWPNGDPAKSPWISWSQTNHLNSWSPTWSTWRHLTSDTRPPLSSEDMAGAQTWQLNPRHHEMRSWALTARFLYEEVLTLLLPPLSVLMTFLGSAHDRIFLNLTRLSCWRRWGVLSCLECVCHRRDHWGDLLEWGKCKWQQWLWWV